jgi:hypothetical protein
VDAERESKDNQKTKENYYSIEMMLQVLTSS